jgi:hypothetical protein
MSLHGFSPTAWMSLVSVLPQKTTEKEEYRMMHVGRKGLTFEIKQRRRAKNKLAKNIGHQNQWEKKKNTYDEQTMSTHKALLMAPRSHPSPHQNRSSGTVGAKPDVI